MILHQNATIKDLYEIITKNYQSNNHMHQIKVELYDGNQKAGLLFKTPQGFQENQTQRKGTIEILL